MAEKLAERVRQGRQQPANGGTVATTDEGAAALVAAVRRMQPQYEIAVGSIRGATADQLVRDATTLIRRTPRLAECNRDTVLGGLMSFAQLGLRVGTPLGHGWLIPMWSEKNRQLEATVIVGYKGYTKLAYNASALKDLRSRTIYANDEWLVEYGTEERIIHRPRFDLGMGGRGDPIGYYCVVNMIGGGQVFHYRTHEEMEDHRDRYAMAKAMDYSGRRPVPRLHPNGKPVIVGPWRDNFESMAWKTEWLTCARWVPMSSDLELAVAGDSTVRIDTNPRNRDAIVGESPDDTVIDGDVVAEPAARETVVAGGQAPDAAPEPSEPDVRADPAPTAAAGPVDEASAPEGDAAREDPPASPAAPQRQQVIRELMAATRACGITGDEACLVVVAALAGVTPVPGSLAVGVEGAFSDEQLIEAARRLRVWRAEGEPVMQSKVIELLPPEENPVWEQVAAARAAHEASKAPTARARKKATEK